MKNHTSHEDAIPGVLSTAWALEHHLKFNRRSWGFLSDSSAILESDPKMIEGEKRRRCSLEYLFLIAIDCKLLMLGVSH